MAEKLLELYSGVEIESFKARGIHVNKGYAVYVTKLANLLVSAAQKRVEVAEYLSGVMEWKEYVETKLAEINKKENSKLGDQHENDGKIEIEDNLLY